jgi:hypothetical protein
MEPMLTEPLHPDYIEQKYSVSVRIFFRNIKIQTIRKTKKTYQINISNKSYSVKHQRVCTSFLKVGLAKMWCRKTEIKSWDSAVFFILTWHSTFDTIKSIKVFSEILIEILILQHNKKSVTIKNQFGMFWIWNSSTLYKLSSI